MPRYVNQPELYACGPTVVINALKWAGAPATLKHDFSDIAEMCEYDPDEGSTDKAIDETLRFLLCGYAKVRKPRYASVRDIRKHVEKGGACVVTISDWVDMCHVFLVTGHTGKLYVTHNYNHHRNTTLLRECTLREYLVGSQNWLLTKEN